MNQYVPTAQTMQDLRDRQDRNQTRPSIWRSIASLASERVTRAVFALLGYEKKKDGPKLRMLLPMSSGVKVLPNMSAQITGRAQTAAFIPDRITIENASHWIVNDIKVGNRSQLAQAGDLPGQLFSSSSPCPVRLSMETLQTAMDFVLVVTYVGPRDDGEPLMAAVTGEAVF